jgi:hypothetical protein
LNVTPGVETVGSTNSVKHGVKEKVENLGHYAA